MYNLKEVLQNQSSKCAAVCVQQPLVLSYLLLGSSAGKTECHTTSNNDDLVTGDSLISPILKQITS